MADRVTQYVVQTVALPVPLARVSQVSVQSVTLPTPAARVSQVVIQTLTEITAPARLTQLVVQVVSPPVTIPARTTQAIVQVLNRDPSFNRGHVTQTPVELARGGSPPLRETQAPVELIFFQRNGLTIVRGSQAAVELLFFERAGLTLVDVSQIAIEIIHTNGCLEPRPLPGLEPFPTRAHPIRRLRRSPHIAHEETLVYHDEFALDVEAGVGLTTGQGADPQIMLRYSDDGGHTWSDEVWVSAGVRGVYAWEAVWRRLGVSRERVYEITMSDPVRWALSNAYLQVTAGDS